MQVRQLKSRGPGRRQVGDKFSTKKVGDLVSDFFSTPTCLRPGLRQVEDKSYDKSETWSSTR